MTHKTALAGLAAAAAASTAYAAPTGGADDAVLAATASEPAITIPVVEDGDRVYWKNDLRFTSGDGNASYRIGGRIHYDGTWIDEDDAVAAAGFAEDDMWRFRRSRLYVAGRVYGNIGFKAQYDFAGTDPADFADVYMSIDNFLIGELRIGQMKEPFSLEWQNSSSDITFMERSLADNLSPERSVGFRWSDWNADSAFGWAAGIFAANPDSSAGDANVGVGGYAGTARVTWAPSHDPDNASVLHVGASASVRDGSSFSTEFGRFEISGFGGSPAITPVTTDDATLFGLEAAGVFGPLAVQAEFISAARDLAGGGDLDADGFYVQGSYFLTGESRTYKKGYFGRVTPESNWTGFDGDGTGAWEVALRYSMLTNDMVSEVDGLTAGLNWYLNPNARIMANYVMHTLDNSEGGGTFDADAEALQVRFQVTF